MIICDIVKQRAACNLFFGPFLWPKVSNIQRVILNIAWLKVTNSCKFVTISTCGAVDFCCLRHRPPLMLVVFAWSTEGTAKRKANDLGNLDWTVIEARGVLQYHKRNALRWIDNCQHSDNNDILEFLEGKTESWKRCHLQRRKAWSIGHWRWKWQSKWSMGPQMWSWWKQSVLPPSAMSHLSRRSPQYCLR